MFKKIINKIIMGTKCYILLKERCNALEKESRDIREKTNQELCIANTYVDKATKMLSQDKTIARRIIRAINKDDKVLAKKLCNQIIKGE